MQDDYARRIATIEHEAREKMQQAILDGKRIAMEIQEQARAQGYAILAKSKEAVELELTKAKATLRDQVAEMTVEALERILRQKLDERSDRRLVELVLAELSEQTPQQ